MCMYISYTYINHMHIYIHYGTPSLCRVQLSAIPWTVAHQAPLSMGFFRQEYWSGLPFLSPTYIIYTHTHIYIRTV